jgi:hypothetical protein
MLIPKTSINARLFKNASADALKLRNYRSGMFC